MNRYAIIANGIVVNIGVAESGFAAALGWVLAPGQVEIGWLYNGVTFTAPEPVDPPFVPTVPMLYAAAQIHIADGEITGIGINSRFAGVFWLDVGRYYVFFAEEQPDTEYLAKAYDGPHLAYVQDADKATDSFIITVTDQAGNPTDADAVSFEIVRAV